MRRLASLIASLALVAAGCGGSSGSAPAGEAVTEAAPATEPAASVTVPAPADGLAPIAVPTGAGGGAQPLLEWEPVSGAASYDVVLYDADGAPYWAWSGETTQVAVGDGAADPTVTAGMTWSVTAYDADGTPLAGATALPIAP
jgi:hypothetical protein